MIRTLLALLLIAASLPALSETGTEKRFRYMDFQVEDLDASGDIAVGDDLAVTGDATVGQLTVGTSAGPATFAIALAASSTTDGMTVTVTAKDEANATIAAPFPLLLWMSEAATCAGVTADTYSGSLTAGTGTILGTPTTKKVFQVQTAATGIFVGTLVDSANPADQYVCIAHPVTGAPIASGASGTNWEGAGG